MSARQIDIYKVERALTGRPARLALRLALKGVDVYFWAAERRAKRGRK